MKLKYNMSIQKVLDFWAAVPVGKDSTRYNGVMSLNETAKDMMELLKDDISEDEMVSRLLMEYEVSEDELRSHVKDFVQKLRDEQLLIE